MGRPQRRRRARARTPAGVAGRGQGQRREQGRARGRGGGRCARSARSRRPTAAIVADPQHAGRPARCRSWSPSCARAASAWCCRAAPCSSSEARAAAAQTLAKLAPGAVRRGTVTAVREFGAFVDLGGIEGLIPNAELSHDRGAKAADVLSPGDAVEVQVREIKEGALDKRGEHDAQDHALAQGAGRRPVGADRDARAAGKVLARQRGAPGRLRRLRAARGRASRGCCTSRSWAARSRIPRRCSRSASRCTWWCARSTRGAQDRARARARGAAVGARGAAGRASASARIVQGTVDRVETVRRVPADRGHARARGPRPRSPTPSSARRAAPTRASCSRPARSSPPRCWRPARASCGCRCAPVKDDEERADFDGYRASRPAQRGLGTFARPAAQEVAQKSWPNGARAYGRGNCLLEQRGDRGRRAGQALPRARARRRASGPRCARCSAARTSGQGGRRHLVLASRAGERVGFLGPNGAGKTTTLKMLSRAAPSDRAARRAWRATCRRSAAPSSCKRSCWWPARSSSCSGTCRRPRPSSSTAPSTTCPRAEYQRTLDELVALLELEAAARASRRASSRSASA